MLKLLYLPTGQMVSCPGEYAYTREAFERYIQEANLQKEIQWEK